MTAAPVWPAEPRREAEGTSSAAPMYRQHYTYHNQERGADMKKNEELTVITKTYDLVLWTVNHTSRFPRNHRHVLGLRIEQHLYDVLELLIEAKFTRQRRGQLEATNRKLETLRFLLRLAKDLKCLQVSSYGFGTKAVDEIGRLVGGWLRGTEPSR